MGNSHENFPRVTHTGAFISTVADTPWRQTVSLLTQHIFFLSSAYEQSSRTQMAGTKREGERERGWHRRSGMYVGDLLQTVRGEGQSQAQSQETLDFVANPPASAYPHPK